MRNRLQHYLLLMILSSLLTSCAMTLPSVRKTNQSTEVSISNAQSQVEPLARDEYEVLGTTSGKAKSTQFYILFFPIGKHKTATELYENAYFEAVENLPNADGILLPRQKSKRLFIPLLLVNYSRREIEVSGVGISIKGKPQLPVPVSHRP
jgi:hypothetical protein